MNIERKYITGRSLVVAALVLVGSLLPSVQAELLELDLGETLSNGLTLTNGASVGYSSEAVYSITVTFGRGGGAMAGPCKATVLVDDGVEGSQFFGNYIENGVNTIQFGVEGDGNVPAHSILQLYTPEGHVWFCEFSVSEIAGERTLVQIPLKLDAGWSCNVLSEDMDGQFASDLQQVTKVAIELKPGKPAGWSITPPQAYTIDTVVVVNDDGISSPPAELQLKPLEKALLARFGYGYGSVDSLTEVMKQYDTDGDGMVDYIEIWSENDLQFALSIFAAEKIEIVNGLPQITWTCVKGENYTVVSASKPDGPYYPVNGLEGVSADQTGYITRTAGSTGDAAYYRIVKH